MSVQYLPLEDWLSRQELRHFPENKDYFRAYLSIKEWLQLNIYIHIGTGAASLDGQFYNDHGPKHFDAVIKKAGQLVGLNNTGDNQTKLTAYEVYMLLIAILLHDAGMISGRMGHEKKAFGILQKMGTVVAGDSFENKQIALISEAHGGRTSDGDKDTIGKSLKNSASLLEFKFNPKLLAAILRFADEICEDKTRAARFLLSSGDQELRVKKENEIFHRYAAAINSVLVDVTNNTVKLEYHLQTADLKVKYGKLDAEVYLIDEIFIRLSKMNCERIYCNRFMAEAVQIFKLRIDITIYDDDYNEVDSKRFDIEETGFPECELVLPFSQSDWSGENLAQRFN